MWTLFRLFTIDMIVKMICSMGKLIVKCKTTIIILCLPCYKNISQMFFLCHHYHVCFCFLFSSSSLSRHLCRVARVLWICACPPHEKAIYRDLSVTKYITRWKSSGTSEAQSMLGNLMWQQPPHHRPHPSNTHTGTWLNLTFSILPWCLYPIHLR